MGKKRKTPGINGSSSADIAFMLLIFFLITTSMDTDKGLARRLPPPVPKDQKNDTDVDIKKRNLLVVLINSNNQSSLIILTMTNISLNVLRLMFHSSER